jgi:hypothetical protein
MNQIDTAKELQAVQVGCQITGLQHHLRGLAGIGQAQ